MLNYCPFLRLSLGRSKLRPGLLLALFTALTLGSSSLQAQSGELVWQRTGAELLNGGATWSTPVIMDGRIYWKGQDGGMVCFNAETGDEIWQDTLLGSTVTHPVGAGGRIFTVASDTVWALNALNGDHLWWYPTGYVSMPNLITRAEVLYVNTGDSLLALNTTTGVPIWRLDITNNSPHVLNPNTNRVLVADEFAGKILMLNGLTGIQENEILVPEPNGVLGPMAVLGDTLIVGPGTSGPDSLQYIYAFELSTGSLIWRRNKVGETYGHASPAISQGKVVFGSRINLPGATRIVVRALHVKNGNQAWVDTVSNTGFGRMPYVAAVDGKAFHYWDTRGLKQRSWVARDIHTGDSLFTTQTETGHLWGSLLIWNEKIYGAMDWSKGLMCFGAPGVQGSWTQNGGSSNGSGTTEDAGVGIGPVAEKEIQVWMQDPAGDPVLNLHGLEAGTLDLVLYNIQGQVILNFSGRSPAEGKIRLGLNPASAPVLFYRIRNGQSLYTGRVGWQL